MPALASTRTRLLTTGLLSAAVLMACGLTLHPAQAQTSAPAGSSSVAAEMTFNIPAQPLAAALTAYGRQTRIQVSARAEDVANRTSAAVQGAFTAEAALTALLRGTGLMAATGSGGTLTLVPVPSGQSVPVLTPVVASAAPARGNGSPWEPTEGIVAHRAASASKSDTPLIRTPQSVSVITRDQMDAQKVESVAEALRYTPGVIGEPFGVDTRYDWTLIRDFSQAASGLYRDGLQLRSNSYASWRAEPYGAERIEVLRGPASVLYGQGDVGGLVNTISKRPTDGQQNEIQLTVGSNDLVQGAFDIGGRATADGNILFRVVGLKRDADTQVDYVRDERDYLAPSLTLLSDDRDTSLTLLASYQRDSTGSATNFLPAEGTVTPGAIGTLPLSFFSGDPNFDTYDKTQVSFGYELEHRFNSTFSIRQNARYAHLDLDYAALYGSGLVAVAVSPAADPGRTKLARGTLVSDPSTDSLAVDTQGRAEFSTGSIRHDVLVGVDVQRNVFQDRTGFGGATAATLLDLAHPVYGIAVARPAYSTVKDVTQLQTGLYAQDQIRLTDRWTLVAGGRHDWVSTTTEDLLKKTRDDHTDSAFTGRLGLVYETPFGLAPYLSYAESFQPVLDANKAGQAFDPEQGRQYEIGVRYQPPGQPVQATLAVFDLTKTNVVTTHPTDATDRVQTGEIRSRGLEASVTAEVTDGLNLVGSYTYLDMEKTRSNNGDQGKMPTGVPRHAASLWADYTVQGGPLAGLGFGSGVRYTGPSWGDTANTLRVDGAWLADAAVHYTLDSGVRLALNASNLFDERVVAQCSGQSACYYGQGQVVKATLGYRW